MYAKYGKRITDIIISFTAMLFLSPLIGILALLVKRKLGSPVIFKQERPGKNKKIFVMYKFRSMTNEADKNGRLLSDEVRLTKFGGFLRDTSMDELPELWNVLKGDMSIVGPRPQLIKDLIFFNERQMKRQSVLPGITGLAQIKGRNGILWEDKLNYDLKYIKKITFLNDLKIMLLTIYKVLKRENVNMEGMCTAEDFGDYLLRVGRITEEEYRRKLLEMGRNKI